MGKWVLYTQPNYAYPKLAHLTPLPLTPLSSQTHNFSLVSPLTSLSAVLPPLLLLYFFFTTTAATALLFLRRLTVATGSSSSSLLLLVLLLLLLLFLIFLLCNIGFDEFVEMLGFKKRQTENKVRGRDRIWWERGEKI